MTCSELMTQDMLYHITYVEISRWIENRNSIIHKLRVNHKYFMSQVFSCSVVVCDLSLQLSEYSAYDFANNAYKVSITFLPPCLPLCGPPLISSL